jgi:hypothetical protein
MARFQVWECKIVVSGDVMIPDGFDSPPRYAAVQAVENGGIRVLSCFSGWGGTLTETQREIVEENNKRSAIQPRSMEENMEDLVEKVNEKFLQNILSVLDPGRSVEVLQRLTSAYLDFTRAAKTMQDVELNSDDWGDIFDERCL